MPIYFPATTFFLVGKSASTFELYINVLSTAMEVTAASEKVIAHLPRSFNKFIGAWYQAKCMQKILPRYSWLHIILYMHTVLYWFVLPYIFCTIAALPKFTGKYYTEKWVWSFKGFV